MVKRTTVDNRPGSLLVNSGGTAFSTVEPTTPALPFQGSTTDGVMFIFYWQDDLVNVSRLDSTETFSLKVTPMCNGLL